MRMRVIMTAGLVVAAFAAGGGFSAASAQKPPKPPSACPPGATPPEYPPGPCRLAVEPTTVAPGGTVQVSGCGFGPGSRVNVTLNPSEGGRAVGLGRLTADADGCINGTLTLRGNTKEGSYVIKATGKDPNGAAYELVSDPITVTGAASSAVAIDADPASDVSSGQGSPANLAAALGLLFLGSLAVSGLRRRRPTI